MRVEIQCSDGMRVTHNGRRYSPGEQITGDDVQQLVDAGLAVVVEPVVVEEPTPEPEPEPAVVEEKPKAKAKAKKAKKKKAAK